MRQLSVRQVRHLGKSVHWARWQRQKSGEAIEDIAKSDRVNKKSVEESLRVVEMYRAQHTAEHLNEQITAMVMGLNDETRTALSEALTATYQTKDLNDKVVHEPDHTIRLQAVEKVKELVKAVQPKTPGTSVQIGIRNGGAAGEASTAYIGMEERMRNIRDKMSTQPALEGRVVQTAVLESDEISSSDDDEGDE